MTDHAIRFKPGEKKGDFMNRILAFFCAAFLFPTLASGAEMTISAAASLANAFTELKQLFEKQNPGLCVNTNFAASNPLLRQLSEGAPVDVFATADQETMDKARNSKLVRPETRKTFALNDLVLIVPQGSGKPASLAELKKLDKIAIGHPASVPAGRYAQETLENAGLWQDLKDKFILADSVRQALDYVARGEVDAGFVYATDARHLKDKVEVALIAENHTPVSYPLAIAITGKNPEAGQKFIDLVLSPEGQEILASHGFAKP